MESITEASLRLLKIFVTRISERQALLQLQLCLTVTHPQPHYAYEMLFTLATIYLHNVIMFDWPCLTFWGLMIHQKVSVKFWWQACKEVREKGASPLAIGLMPTWYVAFWISVTLMKWSLSKKTILLTMSKASKPIGRPISYRPLYLLSVLNKALKAFIMSGLNTGTQLGFN